VITVHKLGHPIGVFVVTVIVVIAIGVGIVAATQTSKVYGPPWGRFVASFPGRVHQYDGHESVTTGSGSKAASSAFGSTLTLTFPYFEYSTSSSPTIACAPGISCYPDELDAGVWPVLPAATAKAAVRQWSRKVKKAFFGFAATENERDGDGFAVITIGPQCTDGQCRTSEVVSNGRLLWELLAFSAGPPNTGENFLASFEPIG
jgi:hypothetical protein